MENAVVILGFPNSGKTTYLAALWHLVTSKSVDTALRFGTLRNGDNSHLNALANRWERGLIQKRTPIGSDQIVSMSLLDINNNSVQINFPDLSGEYYIRMWEARDCSPAVSNLIQAGNGILLFIHADNIESPQWVVDMTDLAQRAGLETDDLEEIAWNAHLAPTQVKIVDILQLLKLPPLQGLQPLEAPPKKVVVMLSAWDKVSEEGRTPETFLAEYLPLLDQYLRHGHDGWDWNVYGLSAQGGDYETENNEFLTNSQRQKFDELMMEANPSRRIKLVGNDRISHDLTEPLIWLMN